MEQANLQQAATMLVSARRNGELLPCLPEDIRPGTIEEGHAIQDQVFALLGEQVGAWKVNTPPAGGLFHGGVVGSKVAASPAVFPADDLGLLGVEGEIAFIFPDGVPARGAKYGYDELAALALAMPALDIVDSRYESFMHVTVFERIADCLNAGAFVFGEPVAHWQGTDFSTLEAKLFFDDLTAVTTCGGHAAGNPFLPVLAFVNASPQAGLSAGTMITTGSFTGFERATPGQSVRIEFPGFGSAEVRFDA